eukprot:scaffold1482_cov120-Cylindrotheca_fusiformis.AAC.10
MSMLTQHCYYPKQTTTLCVFAFLAQLFVGSNAWTVPCTISSSVPRRRSMALAVSTITSNSVEYDKKTTKITIHKENNIHDQHHDCQVEEDRRKSSHEATTETNNNSSLSLLSPGLREDEVFDCDESVTFWKEFQSKGTERNLQRMIATITKEASSGGNQARAYWSSHVLRTGYFFLNAGAGTIASDLHERWIARRTTDDEMESDDDGATKGVLSAGGLVRRLVRTEVPSRTLLEAFLVYSQDYKYVREGLLNFPWDALIRENGSLQWRHKQANPFFVLSETAQTLRESVAIFARQHKKSSEGVFLADNNKARNSKNNLYPDYYLNDFHYQSDGWLSSESANKYEAITETLFLGRQDAMQRQTLIPILKRKKKTNEPESILDVACGTGRLGTFLRDNLPTAKMTYSDLSLFYLEKARKNDEYWISMRGKDAIKEATGQKSRLPDRAAFVQANAETLPFEDDSFDVVTCVYLFHELPEDARQRAAAEMVRVVKPGGMIVLTDSIQKGDRPHQDNVIQNFTNLNEPHFANYIRTYLPDLFKGCEFGEKLVSSTSKTLSFVKK